MIRINLGENDVIMNIDVDGNVQQITIDMIRPIWHDIADSDRDAIEYINADMIGNYVVCCATVSQGQGGIVFVWDTVTQKIVHFSDGKFAVKAVIHDDKVYVLRQVSFWGTETHLELDYCPFGTMEEDNDVTAIVIDEKKAHTLSASPADYEITFGENNQPIIKVNNNG